MKLLSPTGSASRRRKFRKAKAYTFTCHPLESGSVVIDWYEITGRGKHQNKRLVASGAAKSTGTETDKLKLRFTALERRLLKTRRKLKLTAPATFTAATTKVVRTRAFTLH